MNIENLLKTRMSDEYINGQRQWVPHTWQKELTVPDWEKVIQELDETPEMEFATIDVFQLWDVCEKLFKACSVFEEPVGRLISECGAEGFWTNSATRLCAILKNEGRRKVRMYYLADGCPRSLECIDAIEEEE